MPTPGPRVTGGDPLENVLTFLGLVVLFCILDKLFKR